MTDSASKPSKLRCFPATEPQHSVLLLPGGPPAPQKISNQQPEPKFSRPASRNFVQAQTSRAKHFLFDGRVEPTGPAATRSPLDGRPRSRPVRPERRHTGAAYYRENLENRSLLIPVLHRRSCKFEIDHAGYKYSIFAFADREGNGASAVSGRLETENLGELAARI